MPVSYDEWDFRGTKLSAETSGKDFVTSESTLLLVSPVARYEPGVLEQARAVGLTQDLSFNQQRQMMQVNEIGSNQRYTISSSRTQDSMRLSRALFDGESLMSVMAPHFNSHEEFRRRDKPGYGDFLMNLGSSLFSKPIGLIAVFRDLEDDNIGAVFFERAFLVSHNMQISSNSPFLGEGVQVAFDDLLPIKSVIDDG